MAEAVDREEVYEVTANALTAKGTPASTLTTFNAGTVVEVEIVIPAGVAGLAGVRIAASGTPLLPTNAAGWFIGDGEIIERNVYNWPNSGRLEVQTYNEDIHAHTFQVRYGIKENPLPAPALPTSAPPLATTPTGELPTPSPEGTPPSEVPLPPSPESPSPETPPVEPTPIPETPPVSAPEVPEAIEQPSAPAPPEGEATPPPAEPELPAEQPLDLSEEQAPEGPVLAESEAPGNIGPTGGARAPGGPAPKRKPAKAVKTKTVKSKVTLPAGGWLPAGARFTLKRTDQGQDFITAWKGPIVAPASGTVVHVLADKPFPSGFGPHYAVVHIDSGPFGGKDWYIGHCTAAVSAGQHFKAGAVLAHADQGHVEGGGWCELGYAPNGYPGPMGDGAKFAGLFRSVVHTVTKTVRVGGTKRKAAKPGTKAKGKTKVTAKRKAAGGKSKPTKAKVKRTGGTKAPRVKAAKPKRTPRVKPPKPAKAPRAKRVKAAAKPKPAKRAPAPKASAPKRRHK